MAQKTKILVLESDNLLAASIMNLMASRTELDVSHSTVTSLANAVEANGSEPDVVIIEEAHMLANMPAFVFYVNRHPNLRLIVMGVDENKVHIFDKQMVEVTQVSDFLELL